MSGGVVFDQLSVLFDSSNNQRDDNTASLSEMSHVTPIHLACLQNAPIEVLKVLMDDALVFAGKPPRKFICVNDTLLFMLVFLFLHCAMFRSE